MTKTVTTDTPTNTTFGFLYVKHFEWSSAGDNENNVGHPMSGRTYRSAYNKDTKTWRLFYEVDGKIQGMFLPKLLITAKAEEDKFFAEIQYTANIVELDKSTILKCDITEEDLNSLIKWIEEDNRPIKQLMGFEQPQFMPVTDEEIVKALRQNMTQDQEFLNFIQEIKLLKQNSAILFDAIADIVWFLNEKDLKPDDTVDSTWAEFSKTLGAGKNIGKALEHISRYGSENPRTNMLKEDLMNAIRSLLLEQGRRNVHAIED